MTQGRIAYAEWVRRFGVPTLDDPPLFRDDPRNGCGPWWHHDLFDLRSATVIEACQAGYTPKVGESFAKLTSVWGVDPADGVPTLARVVFGIPHEKIVALNQAPDVDLKVLWATLTTRGVVPRIVGKVS